MEYGLPHGRERTMNDSGHMTNIVMGKDERNTLYRDGRNRDVGISHFKIHMSWTFIWKGSWEDAAGRVTKLLICRIRYRFLK